MMRMAGVFIFLALLVLWPTQQVPLAAAETGITEPPAGMILIPDGEFMMGKEGDGDYSPPHLVRIHSFYMDQTEVTNAQYLKFCEETGHKLPFFWGMDRFFSGPAFPDVPVIGVSWSEAKAYAKWRGGRLPTEAEWEYAARGGLEGKNYSHGDEYDDDLYAKTGDGGPSPVGSRPPNGFGLHDMTGNVMEWVNDWYDDETYKTLPDENPSGPAEGRFKVVRGGGWHTGPGCSKVFHRTCLQTNWLDFNVGFRCARHKLGSAAARMEGVIRLEGLEKGLAAYHGMKKDHPWDYSFFESEFNDLGYTFMGEKKMDEAVEIFKINLLNNPESANAYDSLGEAYMTLGERDLAIENYKKSLALNPNNKGAKEKLRELGVELE
ncbi:MAG: SUMF1/EgtB/PvdO family nonheme iron enzyme [Candidatus Eisenbacteria bacterium]|uniref:SUMF1/EgtB/PvdO family nonheme iron enzyme n=1 Tax=Eiseniibacteriota bacterium TaxID=2212470 RepID=A0A948W4X4_UNCEI|nr:SUMF1/EgtB/PvdO family nonheme iron enzyme [Candidatus Eisenbacteria bacterium]MBU1949200.1 SUMF1/EgtB/PvdO family nonheme iron enzyme [Candidatus Eisenbacteria bacterium]MBU2689425.1 SUMF1/EgtB/PvdO family nonheme iron enzyme [Candidatus Eisenbacteria bacterium]